MIFTNKEEFVALPADTRALILLRAREAYQAFRSHSDSTEKPHVAVKRLLDETLRPNGLNDVADQLWDVALRFDPIDPYLIHGNRVSRLGIMLSKFHDGFRDLHPKGAFENPTPADKWFDIRFTLGRDWKSILHPSLPKEEMKVVARDMQKFLQKLPLHELYGLQEMGPRKEFRPETARTNFRSLIDHRLINHLLRVLIISSPTEGLTIEPDLAKILPGLDQFRQLDMSNWGKGTKSEAREQRGR